MKKITFSELCEEFSKFNKEHNVTCQFEGDSIQGVIVFTRSSFTEDYPELSRSYRVQSNDKYFLPNMGGNSLYGDCLDGSEDGVRLDWYIGTWQVEYCYIIEK